MYESYHIGKIGMVAPIIGSYAIISLILTIIFLHTKLEILQLIPIVIIFSGIIFGSGKISDS
jgi:uncharacterized membrane protein